MYNLEHGIDFRPCDLTFTYDTDKTYFPDFIMEDRIIEIKGYHTELVDIKAKAVRDRGYEIDILYKKDIQHCFDWFESTYPNQKLTDFYTT